MKILKKPLALTLVLLLILSTFTMTAFAATEMSITLRVEGITSNLYNSTIEVPYTDTLTVQQALTYIDDQSDAIAITGVDAAYITGINGETAGAFGGWDGWLFEVNGVAGTSAIDTTMLADGDEILLYFGDPFGVGMQKPVVDATYIRNGVLKFTSEDTVFDANWNSTVVTNPVKGALVTWSYDGGNATYTTNESGRISVDQAFLTEGSHAIQISKPGTTAVNGNYLPLVLRLKPDTTITVLPAATQIRFDDVALNSWGLEYIYDLTNAGILNGKSPSTFVPNGNITRAEVAKMLSVASGDDLTSTAASAAVFGDVAADSWYARNVGWAFEKGIVTGTSPTAYSPSGYITRQDLATMLSRYAAYKSYTLPVVNEAKVFSDTSSIAGYAVDAVSAMQQAGILSGKGNDFAPKSFATRQETAKMISLLLQGMR